MMSIVLFILSLSLSIAARTHHVCLGLERVEVPLQQRRLTRLDLAHRVRDLEDVMLEVLALQHVQRRKVKLVGHVLGAAIVHLVDLFGTVS